MITTFKRWLCLGCGFSYHEALGLPEHGLAPGPRWENVPVDWVCLDCGTPKARAPTNDKIAARRPHF